MLQQRDAASSQLALRVKLLVDQRIELERPFEQQERLADLLIRQRGLQRQLDLDRDSAGAGRPDTEYTRHSV